MKLSKKILEHFKKNDPIIFKALEQVKIEDWRPAHQNKTPAFYFQKLTHHIVGQQLSGKAASTIFGRFLDLFPNQTPTPKNVLEIKHEILRTAGLSNAKATYVKAIAQAVEDKILTLDKLDKITQEEIRHQLTSIKGVGDWTADMFLMFTLQHEDIFSFGDLGLKKGIAKLYKIENVDKTIMETLSKKWQPYRSYASFALWHTLDNR